jgi:peptide/nickel transport system substrate-binding protein
VRTAFIAALLTLTVWANTAGSADLSIGLGASVTSLDPHAINLTPNNNIAEQIFDPLVRRDARLRPVPGLAESWRMLDDLTWEFRLRKGVKFHDGSAFTATDVVFSLDRPRWLAGRPGVSVGVLTYIQAITEKIVLDPYTVRLRTAAPYPYLPHDLMGVMIVSATTAKEKYGSHFDNAEVTQGTGPLRFERFVRGDRIVLKRNDDYWGTKSPWQTVTFRLLPDDATRLATLLAGAVDLIENVPTGDLANLRKNKDISVFTATSNRMVHLQLDSDRDKSPFVTDEAGKSLDRNPLKDVRVRRAISMALNRQAIVDRVMDGVARPAGQMMPDGFVAASPHLKPEPYDPDRAKKLLVEAGYPDGFGLALHAPNDRLVKGSQIAQTVAQMLARVGISAKVETMPYALYIERAQKLHFSAVLQSWSAINEATIPLRFIAVTFNSSKGLGAFNFGRYSNPNVDRLFEQALITMDGATREKLLQQATEVVIKDYGVIPLHFQVNAWAARKPLEYEARADERTYAHAVRPGK